MCHIGRHIGRTSWQDSFDIFSKFQSISFGMCNDIIVYVYLVLSDNPSKKLEPVDLGKIIVKSMLQHIQN